MHSGKYGFGCSSLEYMGSLCVTKQDAEIGYSVHTDILSADFSGNHGEARLSYKSIWFNHRFMSYQTYIFKFKYIMILG